MGPCTNAKYHIFSSQSDKKKNPNQKMIFNIFNNYSIFFHLDILSFNLKSNDKKIYENM